MSIGVLTRKILGEKVFSVIGRYYRRIFVDLEIVAQTMSEVIPDNAHVLDIGGGDGEPLNYLMRIRHDIQVTMIDLSAQIGGSIADDFRDRVKLLPGTSIREYINTYMHGYKKSPNCVIISDVIHHIRISERPSFFRNIYDIIEYLQAPLIIKEFAPGCIVSFLGYLSDRYISNDGNVSFISKSELSKQLKEIFGKVKIRETELFFQNKPNYSIVVYLEHSNHQRG